MMREYLENCLLEITRLWSNELPVDLTKLENLAKRVIEVLENDGTLAFVGNGGSAAEASHLAAEFTGKCLINHKPLRAISLSDSIPSITSIVNDFGQEKMFVRPAQALLNNSSLIIAMSTSGKSRNILELMKYSKEMGIYTVLWTGGNQTQNLDKESPNEIWRVPSITTSRVQEVHLLWGHLLAEVVERHYGE
jgi:D-sedoheptulose 7-phosphate isomerase